jgi:serine phosphatase RsbU (regulator of sigma subunit)
VTNSADEEFGEDRLVELLEKNKHLSAKELHTIVMREIADFGGGELQDDATLLVMSHD